jgi:hypothetical protein
MHFLTIFSRRSSVDVDGEGNQMQLWEEADASFSGEVERAERGDVDSDEYEDDFNT